MDVVTEEDEARIEAGIQAEWDKVKVMHNIPDVLEDKAKANWLQTQYWFVVRQIMEPKVAIETPVHPVPVGPPARAPVKRRRVSSGSTSRPTTLTPATIGEVRA